MEDAGNQINIVILDACRNNPFARGFRSASAGLAKMNALKGTIIAFATAPGNVASDGIGKNGIYTKYLLKYLREPGLEIGQFFKKVGKDVSDETYEKQMPWIHSSYYGDFYFVADSGSSTAEETTGIPKEAILNITADVSGAEVWMNGSRQGVLPKNFKLHAPGKYDIEVISPGYRKYRITKSVEIGKEYEVAVHLEKEQTNSVNLPIVKPPPPSGISEKEFINKLGMKFVYILPGTFIMGSPLDEIGRFDYENQHKVTLTRGFYMQNTEVCVGNWRAFVRETGYKSEAETGDGAVVWSGANSEPKKEAYWNNPGFEQGDKSPVTCVSWNDAQAFIKWLNQREGTDKYRLPTEAEWEYAARAGTTTPFAFGKCLSADKANYGGISPLPDCPKENFRRKTIFVGSLTSNAWGLYDMHGNVYEWVQDVYSDKSVYVGEQTDPLYSGFSSDRVRRGGSWNNRAQYCRSAYRSHRMPDSRSNDTGFRLVAEIR